MMVAVATFIVVYALVLVLMVGIAHYYRGAQPEVPWWKRWML